MDRESSPQFDRLIQVLGGELELTGAEIADILWLAHQRRELGKVITCATPSASQSKPKTPQPSSTSPTTVSISSPISSQTSPKAEIVAKTGHQPSRRQGTLSLKVPDTPSLREPLNLARALRPLMQRVPSGREEVLDEQATAERIAEQRLRIPVLKPALEPWLDLALVVDESQSMIFWRQTVEELKRLLEHYGAFRDVRTWGLKPNEDEKSYHLRPGIGKKATPRTCHPRELVDPTGRRLVLVVSDCVADYWHNGQMLSPLKIWAQQGPMAIVQILPEWLWQRTGLNLGAAVQLGSLNPGAANQSLAIQELLLWDDIDFDTGIKVPVLTLEPEIAAIWSAMVSGKSEVGVAGFVFPSKFQPSEESDAETLLRDLDAKERVERFRLTVSPTARKLGSLLSAAPVITLPVVRLIQETMLPQSRQVHVAEVFLGGLLKPLSPIEPETNPDEVEYDFIDGEIRDIFLDAAPKTDSVTVLDEVSKYVARQLGKNLREFTALLRTPEQAKVEGFDPQTFALIEAEILERLGGDYGRLARELKRQWTVFGRLKTQLSEAFMRSISNLADLRRLMLDVSLSENLDAIAASGKNIKEVISNLIEWAETHGKLPELADSARRFYPSYNQQLLATLAELSPQIAKTQTSKRLSTFEFEVVTVNRRGEIIQQETKQAQYFTEDLGNGVTLDMVYIPGGTFLMGSPEKEKGRYDDESPQHEVTVQPFFMGKFQVTQEQWRAIAALPKINRDLKSYASNFKGYDRPVEQVSWYDAVEFCERLSRETGREYRLPSEAEWEYACRAGTTTPFHFGETITGELANYDASRTYADETPGKERQETTPVGSFPPNAFGLFDMHGNVLEWCADTWHDNYQDAPTDGTAWTGGENDNRSPLRGGSWGIIPDNCRSACRNYSFARRGDFDNDVGFRVVCGAGRT